MAKLGTFLLNQLEPYVRSKGFHLIHTETKYESQIFT